MKPTSVYATLLLLNLAGCAGDRDSTVWTLYRSSPLDQTMRIHIATFDAAESGPTYNLENCQIAAGLFAGQEGVIVRYWCEMGRFRP